MPTQVSMSTSSSHGVKHPPPEVSAFGKKLMLDPAISDLPAMARHARRRVFRVSRRRSRPWRVSDNFVRPSLVESGRSHTYSGRCTRQHERLVADRACREIGRHQPAVAVCRQPKAPGHETDRRYHKWPSLTRLSDHIDSAHRLRARLDSLPHGHHAVEMRQAPDISRRAATRAFHMIADAAKTARNPGGRAKTGVIRSFSTIGRKLNRNLQKKTSGIPRQPTRT